MNEFVNLPVILNNLIATRHLAHYPQGSACLLACHVYSICMPSKPLPSIPGLLLHAIGSFWYIPATASSPALTICDSHVAVFARWLFRGKHDSMLLFTWMMEPMCYDQSRQDTPIIYVNLPLIKEQKLANSKRTLPWRGWSSTLDHSDEASGWRMVKGLKHRCYESLSL